MRGVWGFRPHEKCDRKMPIHLSSPLHHYSPPGWFPKLLHNGLTIKVRGTGYSWDKAHYYHFKPE